MSDIRSKKSLFLFYIFGPKRNEVTREWRRLHNEELYDLHVSPNIIRVVKSRKIKWSRRATRMGERRGAYRVLVGKSHERTPFGRPWGR
jgi:hypothetical protein